MVLALTETSRQIYDLSESREATARIITRPASRYYIPAEFGITVGGTPVETAIIAEWQIKNVGQVPISSVDFATPLTASTTNAAKFLLVEAPAPIDSEPQPEWRLDPGGHHASLTPVLLNPGEYVRALFIYTFSTTDSATKALQWKWRIAGLNEISITTTDASFNDDTVTIGPNTVVIAFVGWRIAILILTILLVFFGLLALAIITRHAPPFTASELIVLFFVLCFSLSTGEIAAFAICYGLSLSWVVCAPLIVCQLIFVGYLIRHRVTSAL
jgi:hypothetical protein